MARTLKAVLELVKGEIDMGLLKKAKNEQAYAKIGILGFPGAGKTHTAMLIAKGIAKKTNKKQIAFFDTETGSDWWVNRMDKNVDLLVAKRSDFNALKNVINECIQNKVEILVIDSISHIWRSLIEAYQEKFKKTDMTLVDWSRIKQQWATYTLMFLNSPIHIIVCGRAGHTYEFEKNQYGKLEPKKTGTKMKAETEFEFEPSLVMEMYTEQQDGKLVNYAHIKKDRSDTINGTSIKMPTFENFTSHFKNLNIGGKQKSIEENKGTDKSNFKTESVPENKTTKQNIKEKLKKEGAAF